MDDRDKAVAFYKTVAALSSNAGPGDFSCDCNRWGAVSVVANDGKAKLTKLQGG
jgi:hypothetical protein